MKRRIEINPRTVIKRIVTAVLALALIFTEIPSANNWMGMEPEEVMAYDATQSVTLYGLYDENVDAVTGVVFGEDSQAEAAVTSAGSVVNVVSAGQKIAFAVNDESGFQVFAGEEDDISKAVKVTTDAIVQGTTQDAINADKGVDNGNYIWAIDSDKYFTEPGEYNIFFDYFPPTLGILTAEAVTGAVVRGDKIEVASNRSVEARVKTGDGVVFYGWYATSENGLISLEEDPILISSVGAIYNTCYPSTGLAMNGTLSDENVWVMPMAYRVALGTDIDVTLTYKVGNRTKNIVTTISAGAVSGDVFEALSNISVKSAEALGLEPDEGVVRSWTVTEVAGESPDERYTVDPEDTGAALFANTIYAYDDDFTSENVQMAFARGVYDNGISIVLSGDVTNANESDALITYDGLEKEDYLVEYSGGITQTVTEIDDENRELIGGRPSTLDGTTYLAVLQRKGWIFKGWTTKEGGKTAEFKWDESKAIKNFDDPVLWSIPTDKTFKKDTVLYPVLEERQYTIIYPKDEDGRAVTANPKSYFKISDEKIALEPFTKVLNNGADTFYAWRTDENFPYYVDIDEIEKGISGEDAADWDRCGKNPNGVQVWDGIISIYSYDPVPDETEYTLRFHGVSSPVSKVWTKGALALPTGSDVAEVYQLPTGGGIVTMGDKSGFTGFSLTPDGSPISGIDWKGTGQFRLSDNDYKKVRDIFDSADENHIIDLYAQGIDASSITNANDFVFDGGEHGKIRTLGTIDTPLPYTSKYDRSGNTQTFTTTAAWITVKTTPDVIADPGWTYRGFYDVRSKASIAWSEATAATAAADVATIIDGTVNREYDMTNGGGYTAAYVPNAFDFSYQVVKHDGKTKIEAAGDTYQEREQKETEINSLAALHARFNYADRGSLNNGSLMQEDGYTFIGWATTNGSLVVDDADAAAKYAKENDEFFYEPGHSFSTEDLDAFMKVEEADLGDAIWGSGEAAIDPAKNGWLTTRYFATLYPVYTQADWTVTYHLGAAARVYDFNKKIPGKRVGTIEGKDTADPTYTVSYKNGGADYVTCGAIRNENKTIRAFDKDTPWSTLEKDLQGKYYDINTVVPVLSDDVKEGWMFGGWYYGDEYGEPVEFIDTTEATTEKPSNRADEIQIGKETLEELRKGDKTAPNGAGAANYDVYARWIPVQYYIAYVDSFEEQDNMEYNEDQTVFTPAVIELGDNMAVELTENESNWSTDLQPYTFSQTVAPAVSKLADGKIFRNTGVSFTGWNFRELYTNKYKLSSKEAKELFKKENAYNNEPGVITAGVFTVDENGNRTETLKKYPNGLRSADGSLLGNQRDMITYVIKFEQDFDPKKYNLSFEGAPQDVIRKLETEKTDNDFYGKKYQTYMPMDASKLIEGGIYGPAGSAMQISGSRFDGWYVNEVDDNEKNKIKKDAGLNKDAGFEVTEATKIINGQEVTYSALKLFTGKDVVIKANYVPNSYYVGYAANADEAKKYHDNVVVTTNGGDFSVIEPVSIGDDASFASGEGSGEAWEKEAGTDGRKLRGWRLGKGANFYADPNDKVYGLGDPVTPLTDGESSDFTIRPIQSGSAMLLENGNGEIDNWMIAAYDYDHQLTLLDGEGNTIGEYTNFTETDVLPTEVKSPTGKTLYRWAKADKNGKATGTVFEPGKTLSDDGRKLGKAFTTETLEDNTKVKKLTLVATFEEAYTFKLKNGDEVERQWTVGKSRISGNLNDFIYARLAEDYKDQIKAYQDKAEDAYKYKGDTDTEIVANMVSDGALFAPSQEGKHFDVTGAKNNISYPENKDAAKETETKWTVPMSKLVAAAEKAAVTNTLDINLLFEDNTYRVSYFYQDLVEMPDGTKGGMYINEIGDEILVDGDGHFSKTRNYQTNRMEFLIRDGQQTVKYAVPTKIPFNAASPQITNTIKWGGLTGWKVVEFVYARDELGLPFLTELGKWKREYVTLGFLKDGADMEKLTETQNGDVRLIGQYKTKTYTINFANGADQLNGATPTGKMNGVNVTIDEEKKILNRFAMNGYSITNWFVDGNKNKKVYPRWNLVDNAPEEWDTQMNILNTRDILLQTDLKNTTITVTPLWEAGDVVVTYHLNGGKFASVIKNNQQTFKESIGKDCRLTNPTSVTGYEFGGWFFDPAFQKELAVNGTGTGRIWSIPANTGPDIDVYAKWMPKAVTVTYHSNYPKGLNLTDQTRVETYAYNADVKIVKSTFKAAGYTFAGWSLTAGGPVAYPVNGRVSFAFEKTKQDLFAVWAKAGDEFPVTILSDVKAAIPYGWTGTPEKLTSSYKFDSSLVLPKLVPADELEKKNYTFKGYVDEYGNIRNSIHNKTVGPQVYYALWAGKKYTVTYKANAPKGFKASGKMSKQTVAYGDTWAPMNCEFEVPGWKFIGWGLTEDAVTPLYDFRAAGQIGEEEFTAPFNLEKWTYTGNRKLYGIWEAEEDSFRLFTGYPKAGVDGSENHIRINGWEMEIDENTNESNGYFNYQYKASDLVDGKMKLPTAADMTDTQGMTFKGWYKANMIGEDIYGTKGKKVTSVKAGDQSVYVAKWSGKATINYWNGNECVSKKATIGKKVKLQKVPKAWKDNEKIMVGWAFGDHVFAMWKPGESVEWNALENIKDLVKTTADSTTIDLYAVWVPKDQIYTVTYYDSSESVVAVNTFTFAKGIPATQLKKIGKSIVENDPKVSSYKGFKYYHSPNEILGGQENLELIKKVPKKTAGNLELIIAGSTSPKKIRLTFRNNAPAGVKVTGKIDKKTVKEGSGHINLKGFNKLKAKGYKLVGFSLRKDGSKPCYPIVNDGSILILDHSTKTHEITNDHYDNWANSIFNLTDGDSATLYAVWEEETSEEDAFCYYDLAADDAFFDADAGLADADRDYDGNNNLGILAPQALPNRTDYWYQYVPADFAAKQALPTPCRLGYIFAGWIEKDAKGEDVPVTTLKGGGIHYLTATWTKI